MTSLRFEDLKEELNQLKNRIAIKLKQGISKKCNLYFTLDNLY